MRVHPQLIHRTSSHISRLADVIANLKDLNDKLVNSFSELLEALEKTPSDTARELEDVLAIQNNLMHLCNQLRPIQARATLRQMLSSSADQKRGLLSRLQADSGSVHQAVDDACFKCSDTL